MSEDSSDSENNAPKKEKPVVHIDDLPKEIRVKNMIVRTKLAAESANGSTDMHSRPGKTTITSHKIFSNIHRKLPIK